MENNENKNIVNEAVPEIKTEEKPKKEKKKKEPKGEKEPKEKPDSQDQLCYLGALIFLVLAFVPTLARNLDPNYNEYRDENSGGGVEKEALLQKMNCSSTIKQQGYSYIIDVNTNYKNEVPETTEIIYTISLDVGSTLVLETIDVPEFTDIVGINSPGITADDRGVATIDNVTTKTQVITIRYADDQTLLNNQILDSHNKNIMIQEENYRNSDYMCAIT